MNYKSGTVVNWLKLNLHIVLWCPSIMASSVQERMETIFTCGRSGYPREVRHTNLTDVALKEIQKHTGCLENYRI